jgi:glutaredoxin 3
MKKPFIEIFSAGCSLCQDAVRDVKGKYSKSAEVKELNMHNADIAERAKKIGITTVPSIVIDGKIADCCSGQGLKLESLLTTNATTDNKNCCCS